MKIESITTAVVILVAVVALKAVVGVASLLTSDPASLVKASNTVRQAYVASNHR